MKMTNLAKFLECRSIFDDKENIVNICADCLVKGRIKKKRKKTIKI